MAIIKANTKTDKSVQEMNNLSFDTERNVLARELLTVNPVTGLSEVVTSIQGNPITKVYRNASMELVKVEKIIGATTYTKTSDVTDQVITSTVTYSAWS